MTRKPEAPTLTAPIQDQQFRQVIEDGDLSGYVRDVTSVLLLDIHVDVEVVAGYLMPLWDLLWNLRVNFDHAALAQQIDRDHGVPAGARYREAVNRWSEHRDQAAGGNRRH